MGFYGNITSTNKTQFSFDRIYPSRAKMDEAIAEADDGIYIGRFVLVDYEDAPDALYLPIYRKNTNSMIFYADNSYQKLMTLDLCEKDDLFKCQEGSSLKIFRVTGQTLKTADGQDYAEFVEATDNLYVANYNKDLNKYGAGRGYDGTVWQKTYANGVIKYVMIAELNSVVPSFKVTADAPTMTPLQPHFDKKSNNVAYWLHWQPQWGLRVKGANADKTGSDGKISPSDEQVSWKETIFDESTQQITVKDLDPQAGAIYYNKDGFNPEVHCLSTEQDSIKIEPTGKSGILYNDHNKNDGSKTVQEDIQEISIILPSLGNSIAKIWDLTYGDGQDNEDRKRNLDIDWDSYKGIRMVKENQHGTGFTYNKEHVSTIAGAINSVHDLMGQFMIVDEIPTDQKDYADEVIYYDTQNGIYKRKYVSYDEEFVTDISTITNEKLYTKVDLLTYQPNVYYIKRNAHDYFLSTNNNFYKHRNYYNINAEKQTLSFDYEKNTLYYQEGSSYFLESADEARSNINYYKITPTRELNLRFYKPNVYYIKDVNGRYVKSSSNNFNENEKYFTIEGGKEQTIIAEKQDANGNTYYVEEVIIVGGKPEVVKLTMFGEYYRKENNNYIRLAANEIVETGSQKCYQITSKDMQPKFYASGNYYYKENNDFIRDRIGNEGDKNKEYYSLTATPITQKFYYANNYYYLDNGQYVVDIAKTPTNAREYYEKNHLYVVSDDNNIYKPGMIWNEECPIPAGLKVCFRTQAKNILTELEGFARSFNTIHGLILEMRRLLEAGDQETRDILTVQGSINTLNDIIARFEKMLPNRLVMTDEYGRYVSVEYTGDKWISWEDTKHTVNDAKIVLKHNGVQTSSEDTKIAVNNGNVSPSFGGTFKIPTLSFDEKGHCYGPGEEEVTIPKPSLTNNGSGVLTAMSMVDTSGAITNTFTNLSDVKLDGYSKTSDTGVLLATDSLETGLSKLENSISSINSDLNSLEQADSSLGSRIAVFEKNGTHDVAALTSRVASNEGKLSGVTNTVVQSISNEINKLVTDGGQVYKNTADIAGLDRRVSAFESASGEDMVTRIGNLEANASKKVACSISGSSITNLAGPSVSYAVMLSDTWTINTNNVFVKDGVSNVICPYSGVVLISGSVYFNQISKEASDSPYCRKGVYIKKNGEEVASSYGYQHAFGALSTGCSIIPVEAGDRISLYARSEVEVTVDGANVATNLNIVYLS